MSKAYRCISSKYIDSSCIVYKKKKLSDIFYPVGSIYLSVNDIDPSTLYGGTWTRVTGRYLLAYENGLGTTGGSWYTNDTTLTVDQIPSHRHGIVAYGGATQWATGYLWGRSSGDYGEGNYVQGASLNTKYTGGGKGHNHYHEAPWFKVNCWYRTA